MIHPVRTGARERLYARCLVRLTYLLGKSLAQGDLFSRTAAAALRLGVEIEAFHAQWKTPQIVRDVGGIHGSILWGIGTEKNGSKKGRAGMEGATGNEGKCWLPLAGPGRRINRAGIVGTVDQKMDLFVSQTDVAHKGRIPEPCQVLVSLPNRHRHG